FCAAARGWPKFLPLRAVRAGADEGRSSVWMRFGLSKSVLIRQWSDGVRMNINDCAPDCKDYLWPPSELIWGRKESHAKPRRPRKEVGGGFPLGGLRGYR